MTNEFYTAFDTDVWEEKRSATPDRTPFQQDRDRIIHTYAFRRLQGKTQVFKSGEYDFYRTRLTHSLEVAQIGRGVCNRLQSLSPLRSRDFHIDEDLVEASCLAHDIGHPPFGHAGETSLNRLMRPYGGFEGNAQTLRLVAETIFSSDGKRRGMKPTRAFLDSILKYKTLWDESPTPPRRHFLFSDQAPLINFVTGDKPHSAARRNLSIECQIMDWADDTAYCLGDLMDGVASRFINIQNLEQWAGLNETLLADGDNSRALECVLSNLKQQSMSRHIALLIGEFIHATALSEETTEMDGVTNRYRFRLQIDNCYKQQCALFKAIVKDLVFKTSQVQQLELKGNMILGRLFNCYRKQYLKQSGSDKEALHLLPADTHALVVSVPRKETNHRARLICDHIAGMTDDFASRTYRRMFEAGFGSIVDLV
ncbi:MAG TPA: dNTP triphosphohydrolase [Bryobacteraceae bacterium]|nr:dNTP triphosphohydrolase [Bryobacteraceae bacterium]